MRRVLLLLVVAAMAVPAVARAQAHPDFAGTWTLDPAKSDPPPQRGGGGGGGGGGGRGGGRGGGPVAIMMMPAGLMIGDVTYKLDGSEQTVQLPGRGGPQPAKVKARWDDSGKKLLIETTREVNGNSVTAKEERSLSADGKEMIVETTTNTPNGEQKRKTVYTKS
jgi:hypothetical protein